MLGRTSRRGRRKSKSMAREDVVINRGSIMIETLCRELQVSHSLNPQQSCRWVVLATVYGLSLNNISKVSHPAKVADLPFFSKPHVLFYLMTLVVAIEREAPESRNLSSFRWPQQLGQMPSSWDLTTVGASLWGWQGCWPPHLAGPTEQATQWRPGKGGCLKWNMENNASDLIAPWIVARKGA